MGAIVFSDFDGTITSQETFAQMLLRYAPDAPTLMPEMYALRLSLRDGVRRLLESIPSRAYPEILEEVAKVPLRPGLPEFLKFLRSRAVPFVVVSGGLRGMVERALGDLAANTEAIYAVDVDAQGSHLKVSSRFEAGQELVAKVAVMERYSASERVAIGDSVTDINMAMAADLVFARDRLRTYLEERGRPFHPWETFADIHRALEARWAESHV